MAKVRDVLKHVTVERAARRRVCRRSRGKHHISKGEMCIVVRGTMRNQTKSYCATCGQEILDAASARLRDIRLELADGEE